jgi:hypothetical protein
MESSSESFLPQNDQISFDFVLPGEAIETKESESGQNLNVRRKISVDLDHPNEPHTSVEEFSESTMQPAVVINETETESSTLDAQTEKKPANKHPLRSRIENTARACKVYKCYLSIYEELALSMKDEVRRALQRVTRNNGKAFKILGISSR